LSSSESPSRKRWSRHLLFCAAAGVGLVGLHVLLAGISSGFAYDRPLAEQPIWALVLIELGAGAVFFVSILVLRRSEPKQRGLLGWILSVGIILRIVTMCSVPGLEYDYYRYLWDGAVLANGISPFRYSPLQVSEGGEDIPLRLCKLGRESGEVLSRVSFPHLRTIYPPVAQAVFAAAYMIKPWSVQGLRLILMLFDVATLAVLIVALRDLRLSPLMIAVYWWNPLVILELYNSPHVDVVAVAFAVAAVLLAARRTYVAASLVLALAVGVKLWPVVLFPVIAWPLRKDLPRLIAVAVVFSVTCAALFLPVFFSGLDASSGFVAYGHFWEMNDSAYRILSGGIKLVLTLLCGDTTSAQAVARSAVLVILCTWTGWLLAVGRESALTLWRQSLLIVAAVFLLSPTAFPWYFLWVVPWLAVDPRISLLALNCTLPLYYLTYYARSLNNPNLFDGYVVWIEYVPFVILALMEWLKSLSNRAGLRIRKV
jgi:alpha-1,6-mannosyltransferase